MKHYSLFSLFVSEMVGTALLLFVGLSIVIFNWGDGTVMAHLIPEAGARRLFTGFLFGTTGCLITLSPVGKISGAHINPAMSLAFWLRGEMKTRAFGGYVMAQMLGAALGSLPLLLWGGQGKSVQYGITLPGSVGIAAAFFGELVTTIALVVVVFTFVGSPKLRNFTPFTMPLLYSFMVWAEAPLSGCSTNPARSFGPALVSLNFTDYWVFIVAPALAALLVVGLFRILRLHKLLWIKAAKLSYHNSISHENITKGHS